MEFGRRSPSSPDGPRAEGDGRSPAGGWIARRMTRTEISRAWSARWRRTDNDRRPGAVGPRRVSGDPGARHRLVDIRRSGAPLARRDLDDPHPRSWWRSTTDELGGVHELALESIDELGDRSRRSPAHGSLLSAHDIRLAALALPPGSAGLVLVAEDRWAAPLAAGSPQRRRPDRGRRTNPGPRVESSDWRQAPERGTAIETAEQSTHRARRPGPVVAPPSTFRELDGGMVGACSSIRRPRSGPSRN